MDLMALTGDAAMPAGAGFTVGVLYCIGLWYTLRLLPRVSHPGFLLTGGFLVRTALAAAALYMLSGGRLVALCFSVTGFLAGRMLCIRVVRSRLKTADTMNRCV